MISQLWLGMVIDINYIYPRYIFSLSFVFLKKYVEKKTEQSDVATYGGIIHVYIFLRV